MAILIGLVVALIVGLTGMGGGTFTTPALVLLIGLPAGEAVGTTMVFTAVIRLLAAPVYSINRQIHHGYVWSLLLGAVPGLLLGTWLLHRMTEKSYTPAVLVVIGTMLALSSAISFTPRFRNPRFGKDRRGWMSLIALPIGVETGFSSAGAGALGSLLLLNFSELTPAQVVGTDIVFGIVLALIGAAFHLGWGAIDSSTLVHLLAGGIPGVLLGCAVSRTLSGQKLRIAVALVGMALALQLIWVGANGLLHKQVHLTELPSRVF